MRFGINLLRAALAAVVGICLWQCGTANAAAVEYLQVPSPSMGRDIPVAFHGGRSARGVPAGRIRRRARREQLSARGNAMNTMAGKGASVVAPASGAYSLYTNWEQQASVPLDTTTATAAAFTCAGSTRPRELR